MCTVGGILVHFSYSQLSGGVQKRQGTISAFLGVTSEVFPVLPLKGPKMAHIFTRPCFPGLVYTLLGISKMSACGCLLIKRGWALTNISASSILPWRGLGPINQVPVITSRVQARHLHFSSWWDSALSGIESFHSRSWSGNLKEYKKHSRVHSLCMSRNVSWEISLGLS